MCNILRVNKLHEESSVYYNQDRGKKYKKDYQKHVELPHRQMSVGKISDLGEIKINKIKKSREIMAE